MSGLEREGLLPPACERDRGRLLELLERAVARARLDEPPPDERVFARERQGLERMALVFLREEERFCRGGSNPRFFEVSIGLQSAGASCSLDCPEPLPVRLPDGAMLHLRGRIDRVDQSPGDPTRFTVWDYKTGGSARLRRGRPVRPGKRESRAGSTSSSPRRGLRAALSERRPAVRALRLFLPPPGGPAARASLWTREALEPGGAVVADLCELLAARLLPVLRLRERQRLQRLPAFVRRPPGDSAGWPRPSVQDPENRCSSHFAG